MGMHFGLVAVEAEVPYLKRAFSEIWTDLEVIDSASGFEGTDAFWDWMRENEKFVSAAEWTKENPGTQTYALSQDGPWALLMDPSYTLASDEQALQKLSRRFGRVLSFVVETTGGSTFFWCYVNGRLHRSIITTDGPSEVAGSPLPEEEGIDVDHYYMDETEALMRAFGLSPIEELPNASSAVALAVVDRKDYTDLLPGDSATDSTCPAPDAGADASKPWWKLW
jgi:hypothetical protein